MQFNFSIIIIIITCLVSIGAFNNYKIKEDLIYYPPAITYRRQWYRFFTSGLIHADWIHLIFNMLSLYYFGPVVERMFGGIFGDNGKWLFLLMYVLALIASLLPTHFKNKDNYGYRSLGASGAVSAVIFAGLLLIPGSGISFFFLPISIPGFIFAPLFLVISYMLERKGTGHINHSAHIFGALFGLGFVIIVGKWVADFDAISWCAARIKDYFN